MAGIEEMPINKAGRKKATAFLQTGLLLEDTLHP